ncbi:unnamed protein product [Calypogeia fissa]
MGQTPGSPSPTYQGSSRSPFQPSQQVLKQQNYQPRAQSNTQPQYQAQEPYHPPYERQTLVQQARQQQNQQPQVRQQQNQQLQVRQQQNQQSQVRQQQNQQPQPQGYQSYPQQLDESEMQQLYSNPGSHQPHQQPYQDNFQNYQQRGVQHQQYGQQTQPYHGQAQSMQQNPSQTESYNIPKTVFFHVVFKGLAIFIYIFGGWITSSFVLLFVVIVLMVAFDFWTVKNVSGRILVGLRYWNESDPNGNSVWRFESLDRQILERLNNNDTMLFWTSLYVTPAIWALFALVALLKFNFDFFMIDLIALTMCASNIIGFTKCHKESKKKVVQSFAQQAMGGFMREAMTAGITSNLSKVLNVF